MAKFICEENLEEVELDSNAVSVVSGARTFHRADLVDGTLSDQAVREELGLTRDEFEYALNVERQQLELRTNPSAFEDRERRRQVWLNFRGVAELAARQGIQARGKTARELLTAGMEHFDVDAAEEITINANCVAAMAGRY
jgi:hypothetical protein